MTADEVKKLIVASLPGAKAEVTDSRGTGDHFSAVVEWDGFKGLSLVEQHRTVYAALGETLTREVHALELKTLAPGQGGN
ncbi:MAG: BolA/IbaG family iron-sulfur metabolism protein [Fidelibacterota bacterium]